MKNEFYPFPRLDLTSHVPKNVCSTAISLYFHLKFAHLRVTMQKIAIIFLLGCFSSQSAAIIFVSFLTRFSFGSFSFRRIFLTRLSEQNCLTRELTREGQLTCYMFSDKLMAFAIATTAGTRRNFSRHNKRKPSQGSDFCRIEFCGEF